MKQGEAMGSRATWGPDRQTAPTHPVMLVGGEKGLLSGKGLMFLSLKAPGSPGASHHLLQHPFISQKCRENTLG